MASPEDQLVAAVNEKMDPIMLLVWCEQSLSPKELPTLNNLLKEDDGTLAQEIGWNLLEMILPMLNDDDSEASNCLDCISRRGNPREVVVKIAEVLERLGQDTDISEGEAESEDELPTFAGEADRIHLGNLTLDGIPALSDTNPSQEAQHQQGRQEDHHVVGPSESLATLQFQALMSMLGILHLRIKTQYPSRFLATSLPAALGAFRRIGVTATSTLAFLSLLCKLSGRRPQLPPREQSLASNGAASQMTEIQTQHSNARAVSLPDSEPELEGSSMQQASQNEKAIILKLLQAVLLEALDDYMASLQSRDPAFMSWTTRLREKFEPHRLVPGKETLLQKWEASKLLGERDRVLEEFLSISKDLKFDVQEHFNTLLNDTSGIPTSPPEEDDTASPSDYPTAPSQIPFPPSGILFLYAAQQFSLQTVSALNSNDDNTLALMTRICRFFRSPENTSYFHANFATEDALLSLLYLVKDHPQPTDTAFDFKTFFMSLATFCAEFPDPQLRDAAHHIATALFHHFPDLGTKLALVGELLSHTVTPANLKAASIGWIKDELLQATKARAEVGIVSKITLADVESDPNLLPLLFPDKRVTDVIREEYGAYELAELPYYTASMNLVYVCMSNQIPSLTKSKMQATLAGLQEWRAALRALEEGPSKGQGALDEYRVNLWALDDALGRAVEALEGHAVGGG